jgi:hypothetical protein
MHASDVMPSGLGAPALGVGALTVQSDDGPVLLPDVLHVPELDVPLFSVMVAVRCRLSVHFWPAGHVGGSSVAVVLQRLQVVLTATPQGSLCSVDEGGSARKRQAEVACQPLLS